MERGQGWCVSGRWDLNWGRFCYQEGAGRQKETPWGWRTFEK